LTRLTVQRQVTTGLILPRSPQTVAAIVTVVRHVVDGIRRDVQSEARGKRRTRPVVTPVLGRRRQHWQIVVRIPQTAQAVGSGRAAVAIAGRKLAVVAA